MGLKARASQASFTHPLGLQALRSPQEARQTYGTVLIDLERRRPVALLPDRTAETLAHWLQEHPGVKVVARDRSPAYVEGAYQGAPAAIQVADRFHLLQNLVEALDQVFTAHGQVLNAVNSA